VGVVRLMQNGEEWDDDGSGTLICLRPGTDDGYYRCTRRKHSIPDDLADRLDAWAGSGLALYVIVSLDVV
jgi:hypothetical protein